MKYLSIILGSLVLMAAGEDTLQRLALTVDAAHDDIAMMVYNGNPLVPPRAHTLVVETLITAGK